MNLEQQVCSLDLAKRLKELGVKQESLFCWKHNTMSPHGPIDEWVLSQFPGLITSNYFIAAFTVAELEELLPFETEFFREKNGRSIYGCRWEKYGTVWEETRADSAAIMLSILLELKLVTSVRHDFTTSTGTVGAPMEECECGGIIYPRYRGSWWRWWKLWYETFCANCGKVHFSKELR